MSYPPVEFSGISEVQDLVPRAQAVAALAELHAQLNQKHEQELEDMVPKAQAFAALNALHQRHDEELKDMMPQSRALATIAELHRRHEQELQRQRYQLLEETDAAVAQVHTEYQELMRAKEIEAETAAAAAAAAAAEAAAAATTATTAGSETGGAGAGAGGTGGTGGTGGAGEAAGAAGAPAGWGVLGRLKVELQEAREEGKREAEAAEAAKEELAKERERTAQLLHTAQARTQELEEEVERTKVKLLLLEEAEQRLNQQRKGLEESLSVSTMAREEAEMRKEEEVKRMEEEERKKGQEVVKLEARCAELERRVREMEQEEAAAELELIQVRAELEAAEEEGKREVEAAKAASEELAKERERAAALEEEVERRRLEVRELKEGVQQRDEQRKAQDEEVKRMEEEVREKGQEVVKLEARCAELERRVREMEGEVERSKEEGRKRAEEEQRKELEAAEEERRREVEAAKAANEELARNKDSTAQLLDAASARTRELEALLERTRVAALELEAAEQRLGRQRQGVESSLTPSEAQLPAPRASAKSASHSNPQPPNQDNLNQNWPGQWEARKPAERTHRREEEVAASRVGGGGGGGKGGKGGRAGPGAQGQAVGARAEDEGLTVGTYNLLHPGYAIMRPDGEGVYAGTHKVGVIPGTTAADLSESNWDIRCPAIGNILSASALDVFFLQELGVKELEDLRPFLAEYDVHHLIHPGRTAGDGVAVLTRRERLTSIVQGVVGMEGKATTGEWHGRDFMVAATVTVHDRHTDSRILLASVHFYAMKCLDPEGTLLRNLEKARLETGCECVIWGGECNKVYRSLKGVVEYPAGYTTDVGKRLATTTRGGKKLDWVFASSSARVERTAATEQFRQRTACKLPLSGHPPSDHYGDAVRVFGWRSASGSARK